MTNTLHPQKSTLAELEQLNITAHPSEIIRIALTIALAHQFALRLVADGILSEAALNDETGEASCLTVTKSDEALPFYIQPRIPEADEMDEPQIELYIEREDAEWEPVPFSIRIGNRTDMETDLQDLFSFFV